MKRNKKRKNILKATVAYSKKIAKSYTKVSYFKAQQKNMKDWDFIQQEKKRLSTPRIQMITDIINKFKEKGENNWQSPAAKTLKGIYNKNLDAVLKNENVKNHKILNIVASPEMLLLAYKAIKGNRGALTQAATKTAQEIENMSEEQKTLYFNSITFPDKFSLDDVLTTSSLLKKGMYPWGISKRVYVPKPGVLDKLRPITIPPFMDRVVQKAICMVLEAIYEPEFDFLNRSFGFRPGKGTHDAITAINSRYNTGKKTAIEGDVKAAYDTVKKDKLLEILGKKIEDKKFLLTMKERLKYTYQEQVKDKTQRVTPELGIPQGGIDSPYLFNIYMHEFDKFVENDLKQLLEKLNKGNKKANFQRGVLRRRVKRGAPRAQRRIKKILKQEDLTPEQVEPLKKQLYDLIKESRIASHKARRLPPVLTNKRELSLFYVRYADDWIILTTGNTEIATLLKNKASKFLKEELGLELSEEKTLITNILKSPAKFLGFEVRGTGKGLIQREPTVPLIRSDVRKKKFSLQRRKGLPVWTTVDKNRLINRFFMKGLCQRNGFPRELPWLSCLEPQIIIERYNSVMRGQANFYLGFIRNRAAILRWIYILRYSCLKTLAQKYKTSIKGIFKKFGHKLHSKSRQTVKYTVKLKTQGKTYTRDYSLYSYRDLIDYHKKSKYPRMRQKRFYEIEKYFKDPSIPLEERKQSILKNDNKYRNLPSIQDENFINKLSWVSLRTEAQMSLPCSYCGSFENVHQHHLRHIRNRAFSLIDENTPYKKILALRNRKQLPLCQNCHQKLVHPGKYQGPALISLAPTKTIDNRIVHLQNFIKPGDQVHFSKELEDRGWKLEKDQALDSLNEKLDQRFSKERNDQYLNKKTKNESKKNNFRITRSRN